MKVAEALRRQHPAAGLTRLTAWFGLIAGLVTSLPWFMIASIDAEYGYSSSAIFNPLSWKPVSLFAGSGTYMFAGAVIAAPVFALSRYLRRLQEAAPAQANFGPRCRYDKFEASLPLAGASLREASQRAWIRLALTSLFSVAAVHAVVNLLILLRGWGSVAGLLLLLSTAFNLAGGLIFSITLSSSAEPGQAILRAFWPRLIAALAILLSVFSPSPFVGLGLLLAALWTDRRASAAWNATALAGLESEAVIGWREGLRSLFRNFLNWQGIERWPFSRFSNPMRLVSARWPVAIALAVGWKTLLFSWVYIAMLSPDPFGFIRLETGEMSSSSSLMVYMPILAVMPFLAIQEWALRWRSLAALPVSHRRMAGWYYGPGIFLLALSMAGRMWVESRPMTDSILLSPGLPISSEGPVSINKQSGALERRDVVNVPPAMWRLERAENAPVVSAPWGEEATLEAYRLWPFHAWIYNPYGVGPESSDAMLAWQLERAVLDLTGEPIRVPVPTDDPRWRFYLTQSISSAARSADASILPKWRFWPERWLLRLLLTSGALGGLLIICTIYRGPPRRRWITYLGFYVGLAVVLSVSFRGVTTPFFALLLRMMDPLVPDGLFGATLLTILFILILQGWMERRFAEIEFCASEFSPYWLDAKSRRFRQG